MIDQDPDANLDTGGGPGPGSPPGAPRWVKVSGIIALVLALLVVAVLLLGGGGHGPAQHSSSGAAGDRTPTLLSVALDLTQPASHDTPSADHPG